MPTPSPNIVLYTISYILIFFGILFLTLGTVILVKKSFNKEYQTIATQTALIAKKGLIDGIATIVGHASSVLNSLNDMTKTQRGTGLSLLLFGTGFIAGAVIIVNNLPCQ